jgi:glutaconyl-CoA/methylmalonyl-CoA decarboxylase subunit gamma
MKNYKFTINGNQYSVDIKEVENNTVHLEVNGTSFDVEIERKVKTSKTPTLLRPESTSPMKPKIDKKEGGSAFTISSPLPGLILEIFVKPGDIIKLGQKILSMEAMKMINQVLAEKEGVVESIKVVSGQNVLQGDTLIEII